MNKFAIPWWVLIILGVSIAFIYFKFCAKHTIQDNSIASVYKQHIDDSIAHVQKERQLIDSANKISSKLDSVNSLLAASNHSLQNIIIQNRKLVYKYKNQNRISDTGTILVPPDFVDDCKDCFTQLEKTTDSIDQYRYQANQMQVLYISQTQIDSQQIAECQAQKLRINKDYNTLRMAIEVNSKSLEPRRKLKIGIAGSFNNKLMPNGIGPGLMYEDKKDRNFGFKPIFGTGEPLYIVDIFVPFSLRK